MGTSGGGVPSPLKVRAIKRNGDSRLSVSASRDGLASLPPSTGATLRTRRDKDASASSPSSLRCCRGGWGGGQRVRSRVGPCRNHGGRHRSQGDTRFQAGRRDTPPLLLLLLLRSEGKVADASPSGTSGFIRKAVGTEKKTKNCVWARVCVCPFISGHFSF